MHDVQHCLQTLLAPDKDRPFEQFGAHHLAALVVTLVIVVVVPWLARRYLGSGGQQRLGAAIGLFVSATYPLAAAVKLWTGTFDVRLDLPVQLCRFACLTIGLVMLFRWQRFYEVLYFWGLAGIAVSMLTPAISETFPHFVFLHYWTSHIGLLLALVYATAVYELRPRPSGIWRAMVALNVFFLLAILVNAWLDANYFFIRNKPSNATPLDVMGPWPWYLLTCEFVALALFALVYLPIWLLNRAKKSTLSP